MKILIAVDNQENGLKLAQYVIDSVGDAEAEVMILHVLEHVEGLPYIKGLPHTLLGEVNRDATLASRILVRQVALKMRDEYRSTKITEQVAFGHPPDKIVDEAKEFGADCIVVGCRQLKGLDKVIVSRVSTAVLERAVCAVLVVRDKLMPDQLVKCMPAQEYETSVTAYI